MKIFDINKALLISDSEGPVDVLSFDDESALINFFAEHMELLITPTSLNELDIPLHHAKIKFNLGEVHVKQFSLLTIYDMVSLLLRGWEFSIELDSGCIQNYSLIPLSHLE